MNALFDVITTNRTGVVDICPLQTEAPAERATSAEGPRDTQAALANRSGGRFALSGARFDRQVPARLGRSPRTARRRPLQPPAHQRLRHRGPRVRQAHHRRRAAQRLARTLRRHTRSRPVLPQRDGRPRRGACGTVPREPRPHRSTRLLGRPGGQPPPAPLHHTRQPPRPYLSPATRKETRTR